jgi:hypothetical protein
MWKWGLRRGDIQAMKRYIYKVHWVISANVNHYGIRKIPKGTESDILYKGTLDIPADTVKITNSVKATFLPSYIK